MSTDLEQRLRDALHEDAQRARLVNPHAPAAPLAPLTGERYPRRGVRWVAVAAVIALLAGAGAVALQDDDQKVDTTPVTETPDPGTIVSGGACPFGISGDPMEMKQVPAGTRFEAVAGQSAAYAIIGDQVVVVSVPGFERGTDQAWQDEAIELERGPAALWLDGPEGTSVAGGVASFVQARYFPGSEEPCSSFTVTVEGGGVDEQRATAIDVAERVVLEGELRSHPDLELTGTQWAFVDTSDGPVVADMEFTADTVSWDTGCERLGASYELDREEGVLILTNVHNVSGSCGPPTTFGTTPEYPIIYAVMGSEPIPISLADGLLYLGDHPDGEFLVLGAALPSGGPVDQAAPLVLPEPGEQPADPASAEEQVRAVYLTIADTTIPVEERAPLSERPEVWLDAADAVTRTQYWDIIQEIQEQVDEVVFVSPTRAAVRFQLISEDPIVPRDHIGEAVLVDGRWAMAIATSCNLFGLTGVTCDMSL